MAPYPQLSGPERVAIGSGRCPDCGGTQFLAGSSAGYSEDVRCANPECGSEFNVCPPYLAERISTPGFRSRDDG